MAAAVKMAFKVFMMLLKLVRHSTFKTEAGEVQTNGVADDACLYDPASGAC
jgi:hypothetical protein